MNKRNVLLSFCLVLGMFNSAIAEVVPGTTISVAFESANIVGSGRQINMHRVPVIDVNSGAVTYYDASFKFSLVPGDGLVFERISSAAISPPVAIGNISPGIYISQNAFCYRVEGPTLLEANRSLYTIRGATDGEGCRNQLDNFTAQFVTGPAANHPDIANREIVPHLLSTYIYGFVTNTATYGGQAINPGWEQNELIGLRQSGSQLIIGLFSEGVDNNGDPTDFVDPRESVILTKIIE